MDAITGFKILPEGFISSLLLSPELERVIRAANDLKQHGYDETKEFYKVERKTLENLISAMAMLRSQTKDS